MNQRPVLVVDDDHDILSLIRRILEEEAIPVVTASDGREGLQKVDECRPRLILLDMRMPVLDGWGVAQELRHRGVDIPIVVMTAARDASHWASEIQANGYLAKPFDIEMLLTAIDKATPRSV